MSGYTFTKEAANFSRLSNLLLNVCSDLLREVIKKHIDTTLWPDLSAVIAAKEKKLKKVLNAEQTKVLFSNNCTVQAKDCDLSLLYSLVRNVCTVQKPATGWGKDPKDYPRDKSVGANIERIRMIRNKIGCHSTNGEISDTEFNKVWHELEESVQDIETAMNPGNTKYLDSVRELKESVLDKKIVSSLHTKMQMLEQRLKGLANEDRSKILRNYTYLLDNLEPLTLLKSFLQKKFVSKDQEDEILAKEGRTPRAEALIKTVLEKPPDAYDSFLNHLKDTEQGFIVRELEDISNKRKRFEEATNRDVVRNPEGAECAVIKKCRMSKIGRDNEFEVETDKGDSVLFSISIKDIQRKSVDPNSLEKNINRAVNEECRGGTEKIFEKAELKFQESKEGSIVMRLHSGDNSNKAKLLSMCRTGEIETLLVDFFRQRGIMSLLPDGTMHIKVTIAEDPICDICHQRHHIVYPFRGKTKPTLSRELASSAEFLVDELDAMIISEKLKQKKLLSKAEMDRILHEQPVSRRTRIKRLLFHLFLISVMEFDDFINILRECGYDYVVQKLQRQGRGVSDFYGVRALFRRNTDWFLQVPPATMVWILRRYDVMKEEVIDLILAEHEPDKHEQISALLYEIERADTETVRRFLEAADRCGLIRDYDTSEFPNDISEQLGHLSVEMIDPTEVPSIREPDFVAEYELQLEDTKKRSRMDTEGMASHFEMLNKRMYCLDTHSYLLRRQFKIYRNVTTGYRQVKKPQQMTFNSFYSSVWLQEASIAH